MRVNWQDILLVAIFLMVLFGLLLDVDFTPDDNQKGIGVTASAVTHHGGAGLR